MKTVQGGNNSGLDLVAKQLDVDKIFGRTARAEYKPEIAILVQSNLSKPSVWL